MFCHVKHICNSALIYMTAVSENNVIQTCFIQTRLISMNSEMDENTSLRTFQAMQCNLSEPLI